MKKYPMISIVIPLYVDEPRFFEDLKKYKNLKYPNYEIIVVCDKKVKIDGLKVRFLLTGEKRTGPAEKRDLAIKNAKGEICAFIDDDAYPDPEWLKNATPLFRNEKIAAVGGPGLTPPEDEFWAQVTGAVYMSVFCGGKIQHRFVKVSRRYVQDFPAYNLLIRKDVLKEVGGYGSYFYGGEDTFLCLKIVQHGYKILYDPEVVVYHHRRAMFLPYLKQIANIGVHRGYFAVKFPETSRKMTYFMPTILTTGLIVGVILSIFNSNYRIIFIMVFLGFYMIAVGSVVKKTDLIKSLLAGIGIILTHIVYGVYFVKGVMTKKVDR